MRHRRHHAYTVFVPYSGKIADINESDTSTHTLDLETALIETRTIVGISIKAVRIAGTGSFYTYPNEGVLAIRPGYVDAGSWLTTIFIIIKADSQRLQYAQSVANDDWDLYCLGYVVKE